jgi:hypothetical protein
MRWSRTCDGARLFATRAISSGRTCWRMLSAAIQKCPRSDRKTKPALLASSECPSAASASGCAIRRRSAGEKISAGTSWVIAAGPTAAKPATVRFIPAGVEASGPADRTKARVVARRRSDVRRGSRAAGVSPEWHDKASQADDEHTVHQSSHVRNPCRPRHRLAPNLPQAAISRTGASAVRLTMGLERQAIRHTTPR